MGSILKKAKVALGISRSEKQKRRESQRLQAQQAADARSRQNALKRADDARARGRQIEIASQREQEKAEAIAAQTDRDSRLSDRTEAARRRFRRGSRSRTILTSASGLAGGARAGVARRGLFSILGQSGA